MKWAILYVIVVNIVAFVMYGLDKWKAKKGVRRIPEKILIMVAMIGGSGGAYVGMRLFNHKMRKMKFYLGVPIIILIQIGLLIYFFCSVVE